MTSRCIANREPRLSSNFARRHLPPASGIVESSSDFFEKHYGTTKKKSSFESTVSVSRLSPTNSIPAGGDEMRRLELGALTHSLAQLPDGSTRVGAIMKRERENSSIRTLKLLFICLSTIGHLTAIFFLIFFTIDHHRTGRNSPRRIALEF